MKSNTATRLVQALTALQAASIRCVAVEAHTPDGRCWSIDASHPAGFRLREIDRETGDIREHDHPDGDNAWTAGEIAEYLEGCGQRKPRCPVPAAKDA